LTQSNELDEKDQSRPFFHTTGSTPLAGHENEEEQISNLIHTKSSPLLALRGGASLLFLTAPPIQALSNGSHPWDKSFNVLKTGSTGTIATKLSLVVVGRLNYYPAKCILIYPYTLQRSFP